jgi:hypothetical protein
MHFINRFLLGLFFILVSLLLLWLGSAARTGEPFASALFGYAFAVVFAVGFIVAAMGLLGAKDDYPALLSGLVLYFIVGGLIAVFLYVSQRGVDRFTLDDAARPGFWAHWTRSAALWPLELVQQADLLGYSQME